MDTDMVNNYYEAADALKKNDVEIGELAADLLLEKMKNQLES